MYKFRLTNDTYFDFKLSKDEVIYKRNYDMFKVIDVDLSVSLYSTGTTQTTSSATMTHIGLTGFDNGLITPAITGVTATNVSGYTYNIPQNSTFKFNPVSGFTSGFTYSIVNSVMPSSNQPYKQLNGGFYQGFFKLYGYPVEYFKTRANKGWSVNMIIALTSVNATGYTINSLHPDYPISRTSGMIFYLGTRAENKYLYITGDTLPEVYHITNEQPSLFTGRTISQIYSETNSTLFDQPNMYTRGGHLLSNGQKYSGYYNINDSTYYTGRTYNGGVPLTIDYNYNDIINNAFSIFIYNGKIGYRTVYATDPCYTGATQNPDNIGENTFITYTDCSHKRHTIKKIITKKFTVEEVMSIDTMIKTDNLTNRFLNVCVVFERDVTYKDDCNLKYGKYKNGTLKIYIDGSLVFNYKKFTEVIPHELDTTTYLQEGVPFNVSFGGGSQGLVDMYTISGITNTPPTTRLIDKFFSYAFIGGVKTMKMYMTPLDLTEVKTEFEKIKDTYDLLEVRTGGRYTYHKKFGY